MDQTPPETPTATSAQPADDQGRPIRALCGRRAVALAVLLGLLAGVVLSLPWDTVWTLALRHAAARLAARENPVHISWQSIDRAAPLGLRISGLSENFRKVFEMVGITGLAQMGQEG